jgi:L,D-transpeptidase catalytic domain
MHRITVLQYALAGVTAALLVGSRITPTPQADGPVLTAAAAVVDLPMSPSSVASASTVDVSTQTALNAIGALVSGLSDPKALEDAFRSYYAYRTAHPDAVRKPYLYFVDYGQPSTAKRGYVFDMDALSIVDGPFTVAHGRGSSVAQYGVPTRFSNAMGSAATSLGLYLAQETYAFLGHTAGKTYRSVGVRLQGLADGINDNARARGVVAHGAPYVTSTRAGRSEGCPAMEPDRAERLLPKIANGGMVYLFAPDARWLSKDPWLTASAG